MKRLLLIRNVVRKHDDQNGCFTKTKRKPQASHRFPPNFVLNLAIGHGRKVAPVSGQSEEGARWWCHWPYHLCNNSVLAWLFRSLFFDLTSSPFFRCWSWPSSMWAVSYNNTNKTWLLRTASMLAASRIHGLNSGIEFIHSLGCLGELHWELLFCGEHLLCGSESIQ